MSALLALIRKDLARRARAPAGVLLTLAFPLVLVAVIGGTFNPNKDDTIPTIKLLVENRDGGFLSELLSTAFRNEQTAEFFDVALVDSGAGEAMVGEGDASALIVIPEGFSEKYFAREAVTLTLVRNPGESILPAIAESFAEFLALILTGASRVLAEPIETVSGLMDTDDEPNEATVSSIAVAVQRSIKKGERLLLPPAIDVAIVERIDETKSESSGGVNLFAYLFPGIIAMGLLFVAQQSLRDLLWEREHGHLARLLATPVPIRTVVLSKLISTVALLVLCHLLLAAIGSALFQIRWNDGIAAILLVVAQGIAVTGILAFVFAATRTERQADVLSTLVIFGMSILGGSMIPSDAFPDSVQSMSKWTINYWTIEGFRTITVFGGGLSDILLHLFILTSVGTILFFASTFLFARNLRR